MDLIVWLPGMFLLGLVTLGLMFAFKHPQPWSVPQSQVKLVKGLNGNCSGVVVAPGYVLTAKHCAGLLYGGHKKSRE